MVGHPLDESVQGFDVRDVLSTQPREARPDLLVEPHAVRGEPVPQLTREATPADIPIGEDDGLAMARRDRLAQRKNRRTLVDQANIARHAKRAQGLAIVLALDDDGRSLVALGEVLEDSFEIIVQRRVIHDRPQARPDLAVSSGPIAGMPILRYRISFLLVRPTPSYIDAWITHDVPGEEEVNFERVTRVYREESGRKTLVVLESDFYNKLASYIARLDEAANKESQKDPNSPKALLLQDELRKVRKRRDQIFTYRERKLALLASSRASGAEVDVPNLPAQERTLFEEMVALLKKSRSDAFGASTSEPGPAPVPVPQEKPASGSREKPAGMKVVRAEDTKRIPATPSLKDHVLVHVLEDLPPFAGIDTTYRLKKEDVITLPKTIAEILVNRGKARIVQMSGSP